MKIGLLMKNTRKAYTGGAIGQDIWWQPEWVLHRKYDQIRQILHDAVNVHEGMCEMVRVLVSDDGLEIIAWHKGFDI